MPRPRFQLLRRVLGWALALAAAAPISGAEEIHHTAAFPAAGLPWSQTVTVPAFDPALGILRYVQVFARSNVQGQWRLENTNPGPVTMTDSLVAHVTVGIPAGTFPRLDPAFEVNLLNLGAYDGNTDFAGTSGVAMDFGPAYGTGYGSGLYMHTAHIFFPAALQPYVATSPGQTFAFTLDAVEPAQPPPPLPPGVVEQYEMQVPVDFRVTYGYDPHPTWICRPNDSLGCPCSNLGSAGCANSANGSGGDLAAVGQASISSDTLVLLGSGMTPSSMAIYLQGSSHSYAGFAYGDGVRCVAGQLRRLGVKFNSGGASSYPGSGDPPVSVRGLVPGAGATRYYQTYYRDPQNFCTSATVNMTSGVSVLWAP